jgi:hypothetical protein
MINSAPVPGGPCTRCTPGLQLAAHARWSVALMPQQVSGRSQVTLTIGRRHPGAARHVRGGCCHLHPTPALQYWLAAGAGCVATAHRVGAALWRLYQPYYRNAVLAAQGQPRADRYGRRRSCGGRVNGCTLWRTMLRRAGVPVRILR